MKILEINKFHFPQGGADKHFLDLVKLLKSKGHLVAEFSMMHSRNIKSDWDKYFVSTVGYTYEYNLWQKIRGVFRMFYSLEAKRKINKLLDDFKPDIVHIHNIYHQLSPAILFEIKKRKIPVIMTVHDYKLINPNYNLYLNGKVYDRCRNEKYYQCITDKCIKNSYLKSILGTLEIYWHNKVLKTYQENIDLYIVPSDFVKNILAEWGINRNKIKTLPHFINQDICSADRLENDSNALYSGRISRKKGVDKLINIFEKLEGVKLYLAGKIEGNFKIKDSQKIKYLGFLGQSQLCSYIKNAKFIISGSRLPETFGLVALEAISQGKPFIGFKTGAYGEIIENNVNGMLVESEEELKEAIIKIIRGELNFDGEKIKNSANQKYNQDNYYQKLIKIFRDVPISN